jgi:phosphatidylglycerophosphate synthase
MANLSDYLFPFLLLGIFVWRRHLLKNETAASSLRAGIIFSLASVATIFMILVIGPHSHTSFYLGFFAIAFALAAIVSIWAGAEKWLVRRTMFRREKWPPR